MVDVYNELGHVLCGAYVTERIVPGVAYVDHGARHDPIAHGIDRGGAINTLTPHRGASKNCRGAMVCSGFLVQAKKANLDELREKYPEAFKQPYDYASGQVFARILERGK